MSHDSDTSFPCPLVGRVVRLEEKMGPPELQQAEMEFVGDLGSVIKVTTKGHCTRISMEGMSFEVENVDDQRALHDFADWVKAHVPQHNAGVKTYTDAES